MKKVKVEVFEATDGTRFETEVECRRHEASTNPLPQRLFWAVGSKSQAFIEAAIRYDAEVEGAREAADVIEEAGRKCALARIAQGGAKRKRKDKADAASPVGETKPEERKPVDTTGIRAVHERGKVDTPKYPTEDNPFPAHGPRLVGAEPSKGFDGPTAAE